MFVGRNQCINSPTEKNLGLILEGRSQRLKYGNINGNETSTYHIVLRVALTEDVRQGRRMRFRQDTDEFDADAVLKHVKISITIIGGMHR